MKENTSLLNEIQKLSVSYDTSANNVKRKFEHVWYSGIFSGVIAVIVFAVITIYKSYLNKTFGGLVLPIAEVLLIVYSFFSLSKLAPKLKKQFIDARRSAEILRIHELFVLNNISLKPSSFELEEHKIPADILAIETESTKLNSSNDQDYQNTLENLKSFINDQKKYHAEDRIEKFHKREHHLELLLQIILWVFMITIVLKLGVELLNYFDYEKLSGFKLKTFLYIFKFSIIFLPPLYAALEGFYYFSEWKRNIQISKTVNERYVLLINRIEELLQNQTVSLKEVNPIVDHLFSLFHEENQNWYRWYNSRKIDARI